MLENSTSFETNRHHIHLEFMVTDLHGVWHSVAGILDTGAPRTEFSDQFLMHIGFLDAKNEKVELESGLQTQKYGMIELPSITFGDIRIIDESGEDYLYSSERFVPIRVPSAVRKSLEMVA